MNEFTERNKKMMGVFDMGFMWIVWIIIVVGAILLVKGYLSPRNKGTKPSEGSALDILNLRYDRGEIDKAEFEEKKRDLVH
jgi:putative membrane protein